MAPLGNQIFPANIIITLQSVTDPWRKMMINHSKRLIQRSSKQKPVKAYEDICKVCNGRGYVLLASKQINPSSKIYERAACRACADLEGLAEGNNADETENSRRALTGTGYLRNKKRRRKGSE